MSSYFSPTRFFHFSSVPSSSTRISWSSPRAFSSATTLRPINPAAPVTIIGSAIHSPRYSPILPKPQYCFALFTTHYSLALEQLPRNHHPLNLTRTLADRAQLHIAIKLLRRVVLDEPVPTMNLYAVIADPARCLARK